MNLLDLLFPRRCVSCGKFGGYFCKQCAAKIELARQLICPICARPAIGGATHPRCQTRYTIDGLTSFFHYNRSIKKAVKLIKYQFVSDLAEELISLIPDSSLDTFSKPYTLIPKPFILIPIPLHPSRLRFRGFNQAELLGKLLAKRLGIPIRADILKRTRKTVPQVEMKERKKRLKNMEGVFNVDNLAIQQFSPTKSYFSPSGTIRTRLEERLSGAGNLTILLFDDVFTTGATLRSAASVLKRAGVSKVWGITLAHG